MAAHPSSLSPTQNVGDGESHADQGYVADKSDSELGHSGVSLVDTQESSRHSSERSFGKSDKRADRDEASREFAGLLYAMYPGYSNSEIARKAAKHLNTSERNVEYLLANTTAPGLHFAFQVAKKNGVRLIIEPVANTIKLKIEQLKKGPRNE